jgi:septum formation protein
LIEEIILQEKQPGANLSSTAEESSTGKVRLILASMSPRRKELLEKLGLVFECVPSHIDESFEANWVPEEVVLHLAEQKGLAVKSLIGENDDQDLAILSADTIVVLDEEILNKPVDDQEARSMLKKLSGRNHDVFTGVTLLFYQAGNKSASISKAFRKVEQTTVTMREISDQEIEAYVQTGEPSDKAGAYAIQGIASAFVARIEGCFSNVVGLPVPVTVQMLRSVGIKVLGS